MEGTTFNGKGAGDHLMGDPRPARRSSLWWILLLIIPCILAAEYTISPQPYFWEVKYDPSYPYLLNGLNIANNFGPIGHVDHPGTTVQVMAAVIIKTTFCFRATRCTLSEDVLAFPEYYMRIIALTFTFGNILLILLLGLVAYRCTGEITSGVLFQSMPVMVQNSVVQHLFYFVKPEPVLFGCAMIILMVFLVWQAGTGTYGPEKVAKFGFINKTTFGIPRYVLFFSLVTGFSLATKILSFPLFFFPLLLIPKVRNKIMFSMLTLASFLVFTMPIWSIYPKFLRWVFSLFLHSGRYGKGSADVIDRGLVSENFIKLVQDEPYFIGMVFISIMAIMLGMIMKKRNPSIKTLAVIVFVQVLSIMLICKQYWPHYVIPVSMTVVLNLFLMAGLFSMSQRVKSSVFLIFTLACFVVNFSFHFNRSNNARPVMTEYNAVNIFSYKTADPRSALSFGNIYARNFSTKYLKRNYGNLILYNHWTNQFIGWSWVIDFDSLKRLNRRMIFYGPRWVIEKCGRNTDLVRLGDSSYLVVPKK